MLLPTLLFAVFALLSGVGVYLILNHQRGRTAGLLGATLTLLFFAALYVGLLALIREGGLA
jgi:hypothetical protein